MTSRLSAVKNEILKNKLDAVLISSVSNIIYLTNFSHFSNVEREAFLLILKNKQYILTDGRYSDAVKEKAKNFELIEISGKLTIEKALKDLAKKHKVKSVGFDHHNITVYEHKKLSSCFNDLNLPREISKKFFRGHFSIDSFRTIKSPAEILAIEKACELGDKTFDYILGKIKTGVSEKQLAFEIEFFIKKHGAEISFPPIVAYGKNSSIPHHKTGDSKLERSDKIVLLDFGAKVNNYCSDMTRTVFFGSPSTKQRRIYQTVLEAQQKAIEVITSDSGRLSLRSHDSSEVELTVIKASRVDKIARDYIVSKGYPTIPHSLGHGIGLEVHEAPHLSPKSKDILKPGMVFSIEPGIYIPNFGGVRIEDLVVLEKRGPRILTKTSKKLIRLQKPLSL